MFGENLLPLIEEQLIGDNLNKGDNSDNKKIRVPRSSYEEFTDNR